MMFLSVPCSNKAQFLHNIFLPYTVLIRQKLQKMFKSRLAKPRVNVKCKENFPGACLCCMLGQNSLENLYI